MSWLKMAVVGILAALGVQAFDGWINPTRRFATVDIMTVVQEHIDRLAKEQVRGKTTTQQSLGATVDTVIQEMVDHYRITIIVDQAVVAGDIPDLTEELRARLNQAWQ